VALGVERHGSDDHPTSPPQIWQGDPDGGCRRRWLHIKHLLLTLFFRHFPRLVEQGRLRGAAAVIPVDVPARGKKPMRRFYALDDDELTAIRDRLVRDG